MALVGTTFAPAGPGGFGEELVHDIATREADQAVWEGYLVGRGVGFVLRPPG